MIAKPGRGRGSSPKKGVQVKGQKVAGAKERREREKRRTAVSARSTRGIGGKAENRGTGEGMAGSGGGIE